jgi:hypothetical protein
MKTKDLITVWGAPEPPKLTPKQMSIRLPITVAAKISALCEMYPKKSKTEIISDLLTAALEQLELDLPVDNDECYVYVAEKDENSSPGARYYTLARQHLHALEEELGIAETSQSLQQTDAGEAE